MADLTRDKDPRLGLDRHLSEKKPTLYRSRGLLPPERIFSEVDMSALDIDVPEEVSI